MFTEKATPQLNQFSKGLRLELEFSKFIHAQGIPFLISSKFVRRLGAGQVDIAHFINNRIYLYEVKSSEMGIHVSYKKQKVRLIATREIVEKITQKEVILKYLKKDFAN